MLFGARRLPPKESPTFHDLLDLQCFHGIDGSGAPGRQITRENRCSE